MNPLRTLSLSLLFSARALSHRLTFIAVSRSALLALICSVSLLSIGIDLPVGRANPAPAPKDNKSIQHPVLKRLPVTELTPDEAIFHALNRLAYGPRPGDVERIRQLGLANWIDQQLAPASIDDKSLDAHLQNYPTLTMSSAQLIAEYPNPKQAAKQQSAARAANPNETGAEKTSNSSIETLPAKPPSADLSPDKVPPASSPTVGQSASFGSSQQQSATGLSSDLSAMKISPALANPATRSTPKRDVLSGPDPNSVPRAIADDSKKPQRVIEELAMAKVLRAIYSERQLQQVMDDFWFNHFNVYAAKGEDKWYLTSYERDVIQPRALGKFRDLLTATAQSPAMLFYLDNFLSVDSEAAHHQSELRARRQNRGFFGTRNPALHTVEQSPKKKNPRGLNENYGRELMELHTLGVEGGYTQKDVTELARCFTGWTIDKPRRNPEFKFDERLHDPNEKLVLGKKIHSGGIEDGQQAIELLARHPSTAKFISSKLARRFVSDNPPPALVARMSKTFQSSDGDIRAVMRTMIYSPEFWSREAYRAKIKTPFEVVISAVRALGADVDTPMPLVQWIGRIGEPLYQCQPPTGYADRADAWVNAGALLNRLNFSLTLAGNKVRGSRTDAASLLGSDATEPHVALQRAVQIFLAGQASPTTIDTLEKQLASPQLLQAKLDDPVKKIDLGVVIGLVLGAPEFQRR